MCGFVGGWNGKKCNRVAMMVDICETGTCEVLKDEDLFTRVNNKEADFPSCDTLSLSK